MRTVPDELPSYVDAPLTGGNDLFGLSGYGSQLARFIENSPTPLTMVLDGDWGSGKTVFARQWKATLDEEGREVIYFDAFAEDYHSDPLLPLAARILRHRSERPSTSAEVRDEFRDHVAAAMRAVLPAGARIATRALSGGVVESDDLRDLGDRYRREKRAADTSALFEALQDQVDEEMVDATPRTAFRAGLERLISSDASDSEEDEASHTPLIVIVDELDRCRPDFALALLERIKHFFAVPGVCFFFVANLRELAAMVRRQYGADLSAERYLEKFFHIRTSMPAPEAFRSQSWHHKLANHLWEELHVHGGGTDSAHSSFDLISDFCSSAGYSLRTMTRIITNAMLFYRAAGNRSAISNPFLVAGLAILKQVRPDVYRSAALGQLGWNQASEFFHPGKWLEGHKAQRFEQVWKYCTAPDLLQDQERQSIGSSFAVAAIRDSHEILPLVARTMDSFQDMPAGT